MENTGVPAAATNTNDSEYFVCTKCSFKSHIAFHFRRHMRVAHKIIGESIYKCQICGELYDTLRILHAHQRTCSSTSKSTVKIQRQILASSIFIEEGNKKANDPLVIMRNGCTKTFGNTNGYGRPELQLKFPIVSVQRIPDDILSKSSSRLPRRTKAKKPSLVQKVLKFNRNDDNRFQCTGCTCTFSLARNLVTHYNFTHGNPIYSTCNLCNEKFSQKRSLVDHILLKHSNVRRFYCNNCDYASLRKAYFEVHLKKCSGRKTNSKCTITSKFRKTKGENILNNIGLQNQKCCCSICGSVSQGIPAFIEHMQTHGDSNLCDEPEKIISPCTVEIKNCDYNGNGSKKPRKRNPTSRSKSGTTELSVAYQNGTVEQTHDSEKSKVAFNQVSLSEEQIKETRSGAKNYHPSCSIKLSDERRSELAEALADLYKDNYVEGDLRKYQCQLCSVTCLNATALEGHMKRHL